MDNSNQSKAPQEIFLVAFTSINIGKHIIKSLIEKKKRIRVITTNQTEFNKTFTEQELNKIDKLLILNQFNKIEDLKLKLEEIFITDENQTISYIISSFTNFNDINHKTEENNLILTKALIDASVTYGKIKRFSMISPISLSSKLNSLLCFNKSKCKEYYSYLAEEYIRKSKTNYIIIKPVGLVDFDKHTSFSIFQEKGVLQGNINTATVGRIVVDSTLDAWIAPNVTFNCVTLPEQSEAKYHYVQGLIRLKEDKIIYNRRNFFKRNAIRFMMTCFMSGLMTFGFYVGKKHMSSLFLEKVVTYFRRIITNNVARST